jgi:hypothetical protein
VAYSLEELRRLREARKGKRGYKQNVSDIDAEIRRLEQ